MGAARCGAACRASAQHRLVGCGRARQYGNTAERQIPGAAVRGNGGNNTMDGGAPVMTGPRGPRAARCSAAGRAPACPRLAGDSLAQRSGTPRRSCSSCCTASRLDPTRDPTRFMDPSRRVQTGVAARWSIHNSSGDAHARYRQGLSSPCTAGWPGRPVLLRVAHVEMNSVARICSNPHPRGWVWFTGTGFTTHVRRSPALCCWAGFAAPCTTIDNHRLGDDPEDETAMYLCAPDQARPRVRHYGNTTARDDRRAAGRAPACPLTCGIQPRAVVRQYSQDMLLV